MGLMLVTTLLPAGDQTLLQAVHDAVGGDFLARLVLPLREGLVSRLPGMRPAIKF